MSPLELQPQSGATDAMTLAGTPLDDVAIAPRRTAPEEFPVPRFEFSTQDLPATEQFAAWRASYAPMVDLANHENGAASFAGEQVLWDLGDLLFSQVRTDGLEFASLAGHLRRDPIDHWLISLMLDGSSRTTTPSRTFDGHVGSIQLHSLGRTFEGHLTDSEMLQLFVPRDFFRGIAHLLDTAEFSALDHRMGRLLGDYMTSLAGRLPSLTAGDLPRVIGATRAMMLACIAPSPEHLKEADDPIANVLLRRARRFIQANMFSPNLNAASLQRELGTSRSRLYRLFEPYGGVVHYIQHRRLLDAHAALANPGDVRCIMDIAEERGFTDGAAFSRAFKREFGYSPSDVRTSERRKARSRADSGPDETVPCERLGTLLHRLQA